MAGGSVNVVRLSISLSILLFLQALAIFDLHGRRYHA
jgi:hypothetical protein